MECKVDIPNVAGLKDQELTVGREFYLVCQGAWTKRPLEGSKFIVEETDKFKVNLLSAEFRNPSEVDLKVTSYKAGDIKFENLKFQHGDEIVELGPVQFSVATVLPQEKDAPKVEPFGPFGPFILHWPLLFWVLGLSLVVLVVFFFGRALWRWQQRRQLIEELSEKDSSMSAVHQFHHSMRKLVRDADLYDGARLETEQIRKSVGELKVIFQVFLTRELLVPVAKWPLAAVMKNLKRYHKTIYKQTHRDVLKLFSEFEKAQAATKLELTDFFRLQKNAQNLADQIDKLKEAERS